MKNITKGNFISVIIPVYKDSKGLKDTLKSLENQTLEKNKFEIIVVNDGGSKEITKVCKKFNVKLVSLIPNGGSYAARNKGLSIAKGEYIAFIDADIMANSNWLKEGFRLLKTYDYIGGKIAIDRNKLKTLAHYFDYISAFDNENKLKKYHYAPTANLFLKRVIISKLGCFDKKLYSGGDVEFGRRVYESKKFKMYYARNLYVIHPPRNENELIKKYIRTRQGVKSLARLHPEIYSQPKLNFLKFIRFFISPTYKAITSRREISLPLRIKLFFWSIWFSYINSINLIKKEKKFN
jgi:glycosyltransferase involved in cell wall biosynthesis